MTGWDFFWSILIGIITGLVSGFIAGYCISAYFTSKEKKKLKYTEHLAYVNEYFDYLNRVYHELETLNKGSQRNPESLQREISRAPISILKIDEQDVEACIMCSDVMVKIGKISTDIKKNSIDCDYHLENLQQLRFRFGTWRMEKTLLEWSKTKQKVHRCTFFMPREK